MGIKRLNATEKATYLIGLGVRRQFEKAPADPETQKEISPFTGGSNTGLRPTRFSTLPKTQAYHQRRFSRRVA
jgi:hypothetical protein